MTKREEQVLAWLVPGLLSASLAVLGWAAININRMSESLAIVAYRVSLNDAGIRELNQRVYALELPHQKRNPLESVP